ncbi:transcriptional regulator [Domibacillus antri]|uniref:Transcriptional regulator n=1 Tax=Domibacillus antri TaxID=1714264 RepID=A0A1Q8Q3K9_9BACI|nr:helix-turn-helix transcriptional regulator [Domibacillus antri]OLN21929.1 transcriptional regulator [Domibacillus antri]
MMRIFLIDARKSLNLTHQDVADYAKIKRQYYGMIESGDRNPSVKVAKKIAELLKVDWALFFEEKGTKTFR